MYGHCEAPTGGLLAAHCVGGVTGDEVPHREVEKSRSRLVMKARSIAMKREGESSLCRPDALEKRHDMAAASGQRSRLQKQCCPGEAV